MTAAIHILNASRLSNGELGEIARAVTGVFNVPVSLVMQSMNLEAAYDGSRGQYSSGMLLGQIISIGIPERGEKWIGLVDVDLFVPVLTFVFGEAQLGGMAAVVSTYRLSNEFYGLPRNDRQMLIRLEKEIIHELGHTFGLYHCHQFECVMRSSTYVEEIDLKQSYPCMACRDRILEHNHAATNRPENP